MARPARTSTAELRQAAVITWAYGWLVRAPSPERRALVIALLSAELHR